MSRSAVSGKPLFAFERIRFDDGFTGEKLFDFERRDLMASNVGDVVFVPIKTAHIFSIYALRIYAATGYTEALFWDS